MESIIKILETDRIILEQMTHDDAGFIIELMNCRTWLEHIGDRGVRTEMEAAAYIQKVYIDSYNLHGYGLYKMVLKSEGKPIGICGFVKRDYLDHPDIGFAVFPEYEGIGAVYEAASASLNYAGTALKLRTILAITTEENTRSRHLLRKLGLKEVRKITPPGDESKELLLYSNE